MGRYIQITKINSQNNFHDYHVINDSFPGELYMRIDAENHILNFYLDSTFDKSVSFIDLKNETEHLNFSIVNHELLWPAFSKAEKALKKNEFPPYMDYCA